MSNTPFPLKVVHGGTGSSTEAGARTNLDVPANDEVMLLDGSQAMEGSLDLGGNQAIGAADPTQPSHLVTKQYADSLITGFTYHTSVVAATTVNITRSGAQTIDGVSVIAGDRVLVKNQTAGAENGLFIVASGAWSRATDADTDTELARMAVLVTQGTANGGTGWGLTTTGTIVVDTTALSYTQISSSSTVNAGSGLTQSGNTINIGQGTGITVNADDIQISASYVGQTSITTLGTITTGIWNGTAIPVTNGGTGGTTAATARSGISAAPNNVAYWVSALSSELTSEVVPNNGRGISITVATGQIAVDETVVATDANTLTMSGKTLTSPTINTAKIVDAIGAKINNYTLVVTDKLITFNISVDKNLTLPAGSSTYTGIRFTVKNKAISTGNVIIVPNGSDKVDQHSSYTVLPEEAIDIEWDGTEWLVL
jgi:hypothetical protein